MQGLTDIMMIVAGLLGSHQCWRGSSFGRASILVEASRNDAHGQVVGHSGVSGAPGDAVEAGDALDLLQAQRLR